MYIRLQNGNEIEIYNYSMTNAMIIKLLDTSIEDAKNFFGDSIIQSLQILNDSREVIEDKELNMKRSNIFVESGYIHKEEVIKIAEPYDEVVTEITGQDEEGNDIVSEYTISHPAEYRKIYYDIPVEFTIVVLEKPSIEDQVTELQSFVGMSDFSRFGIDDWKNYKQEENKKLFAEFLANCYVEVNGKRYGVTEEDQNEMALNYMQYNIYKTAGLPATLEWHAKKEKCVPMTEEEFLMISMYVKTFVYPYYNLMQEYKERIFACNTIDEVKTINCIYEVM